MCTVEDCYNLMLKTEPLMLTREGKDDKFQIIWPESVAFQTDGRGAFLFRSQENLYFSSWEENPEYWEETLVRNMRTGEIIERISGTLMFMPDGQKWILM